MLFFPRRSIPAQGLHTKHKRDRHLSRVETSFHPSVSVTKWNSLNGFSFLDLYIIPFHAVDEIPDVFQLPSTRCAGFVCSQLSKV